MSVSLSRMKKINIVRESLPKIAKMLSDKKIELIQRGSNACVLYNNDTGEPEYVIVPVIPDDASDRFLDAIQGFLDHEVAHLLFTDIGVLAEAAGTRFEVIHNILEDVYIEKMSARKFRGSERNLSNTRKLFSEDFILPKYNELNERKDATTKDYWNLLCACAVRAWGGQVELQAFMADKADKIQEVEDRIADIIPKISLMESSEDALSLARAIDHKLYPPPEDEGDPDSDGDAKSDSSSDESEEPHDSSDESSDSPEKSGDTATKSFDDSEEDETESDGEEGEPDDSSPDDSDSKGEEGSADKKSSTPLDEEGVGSESAESDDSDKGEESTGEMEAPLFDHFDQEGMTNFDDGLESSLSAMAKSEAELSNYTPYSTEHDVIEQLDLEKYEPNMRFLKDAEGQLNEMIRPLTRSMERIFVSNNKARFESGKRSGRIAPANLARLITNDDRVFRTKEVTKTKDVAVQIVVDCSGSMAGERIKLASLTCMALVEVLTRLKINHEVIGFTTCQTKDHASRIHCEDHEDRTRFDRFEPLYLPIFKSFGEPATVETKKRLSSMVTGRYLSQNIDGECIALAAQRLLKQREPGKTMLVLSDGQPCCMTVTSSKLGSHLRGVVKSLERGGVDIIGFGIQTEAPRHYYSKHVIMKDLSELPNQVVSTLSRIVTQAA